MGWHETVVLWLNLKNRVGETEINNQLQKMTIIAYRGARDLDVKFEDGTIIYNKTYANFKYNKGGILNPNFRSICGIGYIGVGEKTNRDIYKIWTDMIYRCYSNYKHTKQPSYIGCKVEDDWHCYQNFAKWYNENYWSNGNMKLALDKDILCKGNKVYGSSKCILVPQQINGLFVKSKNMNKKPIPVGVHYHKMNKKFISQLSTTDGHIHLGSFNTKEEAFYVYKESKEKHIKDVADRYKSEYENFPKKLYDAMYCWEADIND